MKRSWLLRNIDISFMQTTVLPERHWESFGHLRMNCFAHMQPQNLRMPLLAGVTAGAALRQLGARRLLHCGGTIRSTDLHNNFGSRAVAAEKEP